LTHSRSAEKRVRQAEKNRVRNRSIRGATRTQIRKALPLISAGRLDEAEVAVRSAVSSLDKAAEKGVVHPNNVARHKSRLMLKYNAAVSAAATAPAVEAPKPARRVAAEKKAAPARGARAAKPAEKKTAEKKPAPKKPAPKKAPLKKPAVKKPAAKPKKS
jgi:small subunit ribosomal protein S20